MDLGSPVNSVRWSPNGRFLAAGSDNALVTLFELRASLEEGKENWTRYASLQGHKGGITIKRESYLFLTERCG